MSTVVFKNDIDSIPEKDRKRMVDETYKNAKEFITNFRAKGTASKVIKALTV